MKVLFVSPSLLSFAFLLVIFLLLVWLFLESPFFCGSEWMGIWNNGWNGTDLMDYHIFLLLIPSFLLLFITNGLCWAYYLLHTLPFSTSPLFCFSRFLLPRVILLLCFRTGLGGLARKRHFLVVETSHRIRAVCMLDSKFAMVMAMDGWDKIRVSHVYYFR